MTTGKTIAAILELDSLWRGHAELGMNQAT